jgi:hypothetical protein
MKAGHIVRCLESNHVRNLTPLNVPASARLSVGVGVHTLGAEELSRDVEGLAAHNDNLLSVEQLLGDGAGEATEEVPLAVDDLNSQVSQKFQCDIAVSGSGIGSADGTATAVRDRKDSRVIGWYVR